MVAIFVFVVVKIDFRLDKQPFTENRLAVADERAIGIEFGTIVVKAPAHENAVIQTLQVGEIMLAVDAVAPAGFFIYIVGILKKGVVHNERIFTIDIAILKVGTQVVFAVGTVAVNLFQARAELIGEIPDSA